MYNAKEYYLHGKENFCLDIIPIKLVEKKSIFGFARVKVWKGFKARK
jgi:hypothetical protein